ncbi:MAG: hypothetical protein FWE27_03740 [Defluviitaleaceae bacterium]|nr:hypothetical protein [Defluviitaleaceae bacterium]
MNTYGKAVSSFGKKAVMVLRETSGLLRRRERYFLWHFFYAFNGNLLVIEVHTDFHAKYMLRADASTAAALLPYVGISRPKIFCI